MQLKGVITSMPTPFNENLTVSEETLVDEITYHLSSGIHGLCLLGGTGEFLSLTDDERKNVIELGVKTVNGKIPVVAGCFLPLPEQMLSLASDFAALGADAIMLTPPAFYKLNSYHFEKFLDPLFEKLSIPFDAVKRFVDPSVKFGLQFDTQEFDTQEFDTQEEDIQDQSNIIPESPKTEDTSLVEESKISRDPSKNDTVIALDSFRKN